MSKIDSTPLSLIAAADLTQKTWLFGKITSTGLNVCSVLGERADAIIGASDQKDGYGGAGDAIDSYLDRRVRLAVTGTVTWGDKLTTNAAGKGITASSGQHVNAIALESVTAGSDTAYIDVLLVSTALTETDTEAFTVAAVAAPGAIPLTARVVTLAVDGTDAYTLADGYLGQELTCFVISGANTPVGTITPATRVGYANVTALGVLGDLVSFVMTADGWAITAANGVTIA